MKFLDLTKSELLGIGLVFVAAAFLRFGFVGINAFGFDEARVSDLALQMARGGEFAELGMQSSTGVPNFPGAVWVYALAFLISPDPLVATWLTSLLNTLAVLGVYWLGREAWGHWAGLGAAVLFAASPYLVFYSRSVWSQNLLAPMAVFWAVSGVAGIKHDNRWLLGVHMFLAGFTGQVHIAGFSLGLATIWIFLRFRLWRHWLPFLLGGTLAALGMVPSIYTIWRFGDGARADLARVLEQPNMFDWNGFVSLFRFGIGYQSEQFWLNDRWEWRQPLESLDFFATAVIATLSVLGLVAVLRSAWWDRDDRPLPRQVLESMLLVWLFSAPLLFFRTRLPVYGHYMLGSLPSIFLLTAAAILLVRQNWWPKVVVGLLVAVGMIQFVVASQALAITAVELTPGGMGTPLFYPRSAVNQLKREGKPIVIETFGSNSAYDGDAAMLKVLLWGYPNRIVDGRSALLLPDEPASVLFTYDNFGAWDVADSLNLAAEIDSFPRRENEPPFRLMTVDSLAQTADQFTLLDQPIQLANGAELQGWRLEQLGDDSGRLRWMTYWKIGNEPIEGHFQQFNHLYLDGGSEPLFVNDVYTSSNRWEFGDHLITWAEFDRPPEDEFFFDVGMYSWPDLERSPLITAEGDVPLTYVRLKGIHIWASE